MKNISIIILMVCSADFIAASSPKDGVKVQLKPQTQEEQIASLKALLALKEKEIESLKKQNEELAKNRKPVPNPNNVIGYHD